MKLALEQTMMVLREIRDTEPEKWDDLTKGMMVVPIMNMWARNKKALALANGKE